MIVVELVFGSFSSFEHYFSIVNRMAIINHVYNFATATDTDAVLPNARVLL